MPLLAFGPERRARRRSRAARARSRDIGQTVADNFGVSIPERNQLFTANLMRKPFMAGNWKMYKTPAETTAFFEKFRPLVAKSRTLRDRDLSSFHESRRGRGSRSRHSASASARRTSYWAKEGAFTGEISGHMIVAAGATHAIVGHSERRQYFGETDETRAQEDQAALEFGLTPIVCVGERLEDREGGKTEAVLIGPVPGRHRAA